MSELDHLAPTPKKRGPKRAALTRRQLVAKYAGRIGLPSLAVLAATAGVAFAIGGPDTNSLEAQPAAVQSVSRDIAQRPDRGGERTPTESAAPTADPTAEESTDKLAAEEDQKVKEQQGEVEMSAKPAETTASKSATPSPAKTSASAKESATKTEQASSGTTWYATETVNVRSAASADSKQLGTLAKGDSVKGTGKTDNGFTEVTYEGKSGWVSSDFLSKNKPAADASKSASSSNKASGSNSASARSGSSNSSSESASGGSGSGSVPQSASCGSLPGLQPNAVKVHQALCAQFPGISSYGGVRPDSIPGHPQGRAIDAMVSNQALGQAVADYVRANAGSLGVTEVIWNQRIWTTQRSSEGWRSMSDRGSATANHKDHVHITVR